MPEGLSLVADIGGTNTRVALAEGRRVREDSIRRYRNADFGGIDEVLTRFMADESPGALAGACVAAAGPVDEGAVTMTNLFDRQGKAWIIDPPRIAGATGTAKVAVLNDLQAQGQALDDLRLGTVRMILPGDGIDPARTRLVIGAGTGFNAAPVFETPAGRIVPPAETGHTALPVRTEADWRLHRFLETKAKPADEFASVEEVLSGRGLEHVYAWLSDEAGAPGRKSAAEIMAGLADGSDPRAAETARTYVRTLGNVTGNLAMTLLPYGGIFFIGGVVRAMTPHLSAFGFAEAFRDKGRFAGFMDQFPVAVVEDDYAALTGCAVFLAAAT